MRSSATVFAIVLGVSACTGGSDSGAPAALPGVVSTSAQTTSPVTTTPETTSAQTTSPATTSAETTSPETTSPVTTSPVTASPVTTSPPGETALVLHQNGIGPLSFGTGPDAAIEFIAGALGPASDDTGWVESFTSPFGVCPGTVVRGVTFGSLTLLFGDPDGSREFYAWSYSAFGGDSFGLVTARGVGLGATADAIASAYPGADIELENEVFGSFADTIDGRFFLENDAISGMYGGTGCGE